MAAMDLYVFGLRPVVVQTSLPGNDAIAAAENGGRGHRRRLTQRIGYIPIFEAATGHDLIGTPGVGRLGRTSERAAQADHVSHLVGDDLGELTGIEAAQAPAHETDAAPAMALEQLIDAGQHVALDVGAQAEVASEFPAAGHVAVRIEKATQSASAPVVRQQPGQNENRVAIAPRHDGGEPWTCEPKSAEFRQDARLQQLQRRRWGRKRRLCSAHRVAPSASALWWTLRAAALMQLVSNVLSFRPSCLRCELAQGRSIRATRSMIRTSMRLPSSYQALICWFSAERHAVVRQVIAAALIDGLRRSPRSLYAGCQPSADRLGQAVSEGPHAAG